MLNESLKKYFENTNLYTITSDNCWIWKGEINKNGLAITQPPTYEIKLPAIGFMWQLYKGKAPYEKVPLLKCGNNNCVNPEHCEWGEKVKKKKITKEDYEEIKRLREEGKNNKEIAKIYKVSESTIYNAVKDF